MRRAIYALAFLGLTGTLVAQAPTGQRLAVGQSGRWMAWASEERLADGTVVFKRLSVMQNGVTITGESAVAVEGGFEFTGKTRVVFDR